MIWVGVIFLIIFWVWCVYELINATAMPDDFTNEPEDYCDEQYFITRKDEEDGIS
jgi:hypothetical protein